MYYIDTHIIWAEFRSVDLQHYYNILIVTKHVELRLVDSYYYYNLSSIVIDWYRQNRDYQISQYYYKSLIEIDTILYYYYFISIVID